MASEQIDPQPRKYWPSMESLKAYGQKNLLATLLFVDFTKAFDSIHRGKMEQILLAYGLPKRNRGSNNNSLQKHQSESTFTVWRHRILRPCSRSTTKGHACPIPLYHLSRTTCLELRSTKSEKMASSWQRKEAEGTPQKQLPTPTTPMT